MSNENDIQDIQRQIVTASSTIAEALRRDYDIELRLTSDGKLRVVRTLKKFLVVDGL